MQQKHPVIVVLMSACVALASPVFAASAWPDRYNDCLGMDNPGDAEEACNDALTSPALSVLERSEVYRQLGKLNRLDERLGAAKSDLEASLALVPESPETLAEMGAVLYLEADYKGASEALSKAIVGGILGGAVYNNRGLALLALGEIKDAMRDFDAAIELASENGTIWNNRANALCASGDIEGAYRDRIQALYNRRFTASQAQAGLRNSGFYDGPADGIWGFDSEDALRAWTEAGCPNAPKSRLQ
ncbi:MAG: tetratricopeptide repeat protein [Pseudomonadota bacterium]